jgi:site-specific recombinase XerD
MPIYMRITVDGLSKEMTTSRHCDPRLWDQQLEKAIGKNESQMELNHHLSTLRLKVYQARISLMESNKVITAEAIKFLLIGKPDKSRMILEVFKEHNERMNLLVNSEYSPSTLKRYKTSMDHTRYFIKWKYNVEDYEITKLDFEFISEYEFWFKSIRKCNHNSTIKYISNFRKVINGCIRRGWLQKDPFFGFKMSKREVEIIPLSGEDLKAIEDKSLPNDRLRQVRDIFLFCCYTGLAYVDIKKLKRTEITIGIDGGKWIHTKRQKTEVPSRIPLLPAALQIMEKYDNHIQCLNDNRLLPVLSNQKMNAYLKEIADLCNIDKKLTFHIARHTFATTVTLSNGVPIETVSKMLGHRNLKTTQHYAKILDRKVSDDMKELRERLATTQQFTDRSRNPSY